MGNDRKKYTWAYIQLEKNAVWLRCSGCMVDRKLDLSKAIEAFGNLDMKEAADLYDRFKCAKCGHKGFYYTIELERNEANYFPNLKIQFKKNIKRPIRW